MNTLFARAITGFAIIAMLVVALMPGNAAAQDGGSAEEVVNRITTAAENFEANVDSYTITTINAQTLSLALEIPLLGASTTQEDVSVAEVLVDVTYLDDETVVATGFVTSTTDATTTENGEVSSQTSSAIDAELRLVDDSIYMNAQVIESEGAAFIAPPEGWVVLVDDVNAADELDELYNFSFTGLDNWNLSLGDVSGETEDSDLQEIIDVFDLASEITTIDDELPDGTPVEVIVVTVPAASLLESGSDFFPAPDTQDEATQGIFDALFADLTFEFNFAIDADEIYRGYYFAISTDLASDDLAGLFGDETFAGIEGSIELGFDIEQIQLFTNLNTAFDAVEAPEVAE